ncbi:F0F1 ATP synthase subunit B [Mycoplasma phocoenae]|uniref:ATP synthase subunit b n=1 Tax=Mycoplasma phocoenae TaxID=754517 RepID=A0A858U4J4_9MOLU|nr:F0F1 ATP synthase subunit B [Mycoplasma phocoenae]QJG66999.1 F0F1 ATP synthase subunit B [Mycoplasma phocoenae]
MTHIQLMSEGGVNEELKNVFTNFAFQLPYFIFTIISFVVTILVLTFLVYKPVKKALKKRQEFIQKNIDDSVQAKTAAIELQNEANESLIETYRKADMIIHDAKIDGEKIVDVLTKDAKAKAEHMIQQTNISINKGWRDFEKEEKRIITENAIEIAKKIIGREIKDEENKKMIQQLLDEAS